MPLILHIVTTGDKFRCVFVLFCDFCLSCFCLGFCLVSWLVDLGWLGCLFGAVSLFLLFFWATRKTFFFWCRNFAKLRWVFSLFSSQSLSLFLDRYVSLCSLEHTALHIYVGRDYNTCLQVLVTHRKLEYLLQPMCVFDQSLPTLKETVL